MVYYAKTPKSWGNIDEEFDTDNVYFNLLSKYEDEDVVFEIIKKDGQIKKLSKKKCINLSINLASRIEDNTKNKKKHAQLKIMGILGASEESAILMLASLYLGAHHCICFEDLSSEAICQRLEIFKPHLIICKNHIKEKIESAISETYFLKLQILIIDINSINDYKIPNKSPLPYKKNSNLFTLFTSGSTGKPKAIIHGVGPYLLYAKFTTKYFFGLAKNSKIFTAVDAGWINGHTYAFYGPLLLGAISIINEIPTLISIPRILGLYLNQLRPDCFYTSVTLLRLLKSMVRKNENFSSFVDKDFKLERIGSCGEPLAHHVGEWAINFFKTKRKSIVNTYFQTETGGIIVAPRDEDGEPSDFSCVGKPRKEIILAQAKDLISPEGLIKESLQPNELLIKNHWNGIFRMVISDKETNYFTKDGYFRLHDVGHIDDKGYLYIGGRSDDVINVSGHRISTSEIESVCLENDSIKEACAVSTPDKLSGEKIVLYFSKTKKIIDNELLINQIKKNIRQKLSNYHLPSRLEEFNELPKTQSGKIMRRIMRDLADGKKFDESRDYTTLANKEAFLKSKDIFINARKK